MLCFISSILIACTLICYGYKKRIQKLHTFIIQSRSNVRSTVTHSTGSKASIPLIFGDKINLKQSYYVLSISAEKTQTWSCRVTWDHKPEAVG